MEIEGKRLYTVGEAAVLLSRTGESIRRLVRLGHLRGRSIGRRVYILGDDLLTAGQETVPLMVKRAEAQAGKRVKGAKK